LQHGIILDDKWALARLLGNNNTTKYTDDNPNLVTLESHCFRGGDFVTFANRVGLLDNNKKSECCDDLTQRYQYEDLLPRILSNTKSSQPPPSPNNLWVIKDAMSNGAGGIWIVDESNVHDFLTYGEEDTVNTQQTSSSTTSILHPTHRYIAQRYAWPPTLYNRRKCHVRVYALITSDGKAYIHRKAFLHVANELFSNGENNDDDKKEESSGEKNDKKMKFEPSVHITNCCANSHDLHKFAGEICVDLKTVPPSFSDDDGEKLKNGNSDTELPLGDYFPSISASVAELAKSFGSFIKGGEANGGFEYLGLDFVLSSIKDEEDDCRKPVAYLLEVNAPPSQDTATGLPHAEALHDEVISDLLHMWVLPNVLGISKEEKEPRNCGGWNCVYSPTDDEGESSNDNLIVPSKAAIINRIRWALFEKRALKEEELLKKSTSTSPIELSKETSLATQENTEKCEWTNRFDQDAFVSFARSQFPYFTKTSTPEDNIHNIPVFFESSGGSQVPSMVSNAVVASMSNRDRSVVGSTQQKEARKALLALLTDQDCQYMSSTNELAVLGMNATSLLNSLARKMSSIISKGDEIIISSENHLANVTPWLILAKAAGAKVKWWTVTASKDDINESCILSNLVTERTRVVAVSHVSNVLGIERDIPAICSLVHRVTNGKGQVVVDGVAASPHLLSSEAITLGRPDWYVVSLHKLFGPHLGCLVGKRENMIQLNCTEESEHNCLSNEDLSKSWEPGTMNYEACCGARAVEEYFDLISAKALEMSSRQTSNQITAESSDYHSRNNTDAPISHKSIARICIQSVENRLLHHLLGYLQTCSNVRIIQDASRMKVNSSYDEDKTDLQRIPIVCFVHESINSQMIVDHCRKNEVVCRSGKFLSTSRLWNELGIERNVEVVRFSLAHYNTLDEINTAIRVLEMINRWS